MNTALWIAQWLLAALFLFTGGVKLVTPIEQLTQQIHLPGALIRFIGAAEVLGALGLVLPGLLKIRQGLTLLAAIGLIVIMVGAVVVSWPMGLKMVALPFCTGLLLIFVAYGRSRRH